MSQANQVNAMHDFGCEQTGSHLRCLPKQSRPMSRQTKIALATVTTLTLATGFILTHVDGAYASTSIAATGTIDTISTFAASWWPAVEQFWKALHP